MKVSRITLVTSSLTCGGAEKNVALLANEWAKRGKQITVISFDRHPPFFTLDDAVQLVKIDITRSYRRLWKDFVTAPARLATLRRALVNTRPDLVVSFMDINNLLTLLASRGLSTPIFVAERSDPRIWPIQRGWRLMRSLLYPFAQRVITQTEGAKSFFASTSDQKVVAIPNPVMSLTPLVASSTTHREPRIVSTGRLVGMKRFDILVHAFASVRSKFPGWSLDILGDGEERQKLQALIQSLGLSAAVHLHGTVSNPGPFLEKASLFVLCSDFEGFPNALAEALAAGVPAISTDTQGGRELIRNEENGLLVPTRNTERLSQALEQLMSNPSLRKRMSHSALEQIQKYSLESVLARWESEFSAI